MGRRKGFFAQLAASIQEAERAERRRQRELLAQQRHAEKMHLALSRQTQRLKAEIERERERMVAQLEAETYQNRIQVLSSVHRDATPTIDWINAANQPEPQLQAVPDTAVKQAREALATYAPSLIERLLRREAKRRAALLDAVTSAEADVRRLRERAQAEYAEARSAWRDQLALAKLVLSGDLTAYQRVLEDSDCFEELAELGCAVNVQWQSKQVARAALAAQEADVVPAEERSVTTRGKLSTKKLAPARVAEIYQDFLCGAALRVARELFAVLPLQAVCVDVYTSLLNSATGHFEPTPVLSVYCPRERFATLNFVRADASDVVTSLRNSMRFQRSKGMERVELLQ